MIPVSDGDTFDVGVLKREERALLYDLGAGLVDEVTPEHVAFDMEYGKIGSELWQALRFELHRTLCDPKRREPKLWVRELIGGDIRNLLTGIACSVAATYSVGLGVAVPAAALVIKAGVQSFCSKHKPDGSVPPVEDVIWNIKGQMESAVRDVLRPGLPGEQTEEE